MKDAVHNLFRMRWLSLVILLVLFLFMGRRICLGEIIEGRDDGSGLYAMSAGDGYYVLSGHDYVWPSTVIRVTYSGRTGKVILSGANVQSYIEWNRVNDCSFVQVQKGEWISFSSIRESIYCNSSYFQQIHPNESSQDRVKSGSTISAEVGSLVYLAFVVEGWPQSFGWVALRVYRTGIDVEWCMLETDYSSGSLRVGYRVLVVPVDGGTWQKDVYVDAAASGEEWGYFWEGAWPTIQNGINALRIQDSTIHVRPGVYGAISLVDIPCFEPVGEKHLVIESTGGPSVTFIDGGGLALDGQGSVTGGVWCVSCGDETTFPHVTLRGFTLRNGFGGARGVKCLENCVIENCHWGLSNTTANSCMLKGVSSHLAPGSSVKARIGATPEGFRVSSIIGNGQQTSTGDCLLGATSLTARVWSVTTNFTDSAFMRTNHFFKVGIGPPVH